MTQATHWRYKALGPDPVVKVVENKSKYSKVVSPLMGFSEQDDLGLVEEVTHFASGTRETSTKEPFYPTGVEGGLELAGWREGVMFSGLSL